MCPSMKPLQLCTQAMATAVICMSHLYSVAEIASCAANNVIPQEVMKANGTLRALPAASQVLFIHLCSTMINGLAVYLSLDQNLLKLEHAGDMF